MFPTQNNHILIGTIRNEIQLHRLEQSIFLSEIENRREEKQEKKRKKCLGIANRSHNRIVLEKGTSARSGMIQVNMSAGSTLHTNVE